MSISVESILKKYGEQTAVNNITFAVSKGEVVGFLGPNGAGKSTTMKMLTGYLNPDGGKAYVCGVEVQSDPLAVKSKTGYLPESNPLYYDMYVREYLDFIGSVHRIPNLKQRIEEVISRVGLTPESNKKIGQLSKGYKQRVGLAAALIHDPEVLILDEPTRGIDVGAKGEIAALVDKLRREGMSLLVISSEVEELVQMCQRTVILRDRRKVGELSGSEVSERNILQRIAG